MSSHLSYRISAHILHLWKPKQNAFYKSAQNLSCIRSIQLSRHPQKVRPPVQCFHRHQYVVVEGIELVELSWLTTVRLVGVGRLWMGSEARLTWNALLLIIEVASLAKVLFLLKSCAGMKSSDLGGSWKPEYIVTHRKLNLKIGKHPKHL